MRVYHGSGELLWLVPSAVVVVRMLRQFLNLPVRLPRWNALLGWIWVPGAALFAVTQAFGGVVPHPGDTYWLLVLLVVLGVLAAVRDYRPARMLLLAVVPLVLYTIAEYVLEEAYGRVPKNYASSLDTAQFFVLIWLGTFFFIARSQKKNLEKERLLREEEERAKRLIEGQNQELERLVAERTAALTLQAEELRGALTELRAAQARLIQSEKMASLGELTAGIAHEIQNPLNFVNNFAEVSAELVAELEEARRRPARDPGLEAGLLADLGQNLAKIGQHGGRAAGIVRGMLEHSRTSGGARAPADLNALCGEYLRLAYHGLRAKDKGFNAALETDLAPGLPPVAVAAADLGRVLLNLCTNAFYAVRQRQRAGGAGYAPAVRVSTRRAGGAVEIRVRDNGAGMSAAVRAKAFQPFFTTKPPGEGTGLGLSLSHDIVTKGHGGTLEVDSQEGKYTEFVICLPLPPAG